jgi:hypothetical protein
MYLIGGIYADDVENGLLICGVDRSVASPEEEGCWEIGDREQPSLYRETPGVFAGRWTS